MKNLLLTICVIYVYLFHQVILNNACRTDLDDVPSKTYLAPIVIEGLLIAKSVPVSHRHIATFNIKKIHKGVLDETIPIILEFENFSGKNGFISHHNCTFQLNLDIDKVYILFLEHSFTTDSFYNFTIFAEPVLSTKINIRDLKKIISCKKCAPSVKVFKNISTTIDKEINLRCKFTGFPVPKIAWLKDGEPIKLKKGIKIIKSRQNSKLKIFKAKPEDTGEYVCMASNIIGPPASEKVQVIVKEGSKKKINKGTNSIQGSNKEPQEPKKKPGTPKNSTSSNAKPKTNKDKLTPIKDKQSSSKDKSSSNKDKTLSNKDKTATNKDKTLSNKDKPSSNKNKTATNKDKDKSPSSKDKMTSTKDKPSSKDKSISSKDKSVTSKNKPASSKDKLASNKNKTGSGTDKQSSKPSKQGSKPNKQESKPIKQGSKPNKQSSNGKIDKPSKPQRPWNHTSPINVTQLWKELPCLLENFCQNGGTCTYYETISSHVCQCALGYHGHRCIKKDLLPENKKVKEKYPVIVITASICGGLFILLLILFVYHCYHYFYRKKKKRLRRRTNENTSGAYLASNGGVPMHHMTRLHRNTDELANNIETSFMSSGEPPSSDVSQIQEYDSPETNSPYNNKMRKYGISSVTDLEQENMVFIEPRIVVGIKSDSKLAITPPATRKQMPVNNFPHMAASSFKPHRIQSLSDNFLSRPVSSEKTAKQMSSSLSCVDNKERNNLVISTLSVHSEEELTSHDNEKNSAFKSEYEEIEGDDYCDALDSSDSSFSKNNSGIGLLDQHSFAFQNNFAHSNQDSTGNLSWDDDIYWPSG